MEREYTIEDLLADIQAANRVGKICQIRVVMRVEADEDEQNQMWHTGGLDGWDTEMRSSHYVTIEREVEASNT